jgi:hypothetical protein
VSLAVEEATHVVAHGGQISVQALPVQDEDEEDDGEDDRHAHVAHGFGRHPVIVGADALAHTGRHLVLVHGQVLPVLGQHFRYVGWDLVGRPQTFELLARAHAGV